MIKNNLPELARKLRINNIQIAKDIYYVFGSLYGNKSIRENYELLKKRLMQVRHGYPREVAFEVISKCNLDCDFCVIRELKTWKYRRKVFMTFNQFKTILDNISLFSTYISFSGAEPLMNKDIFKMFDYARKKNIYTELNTNAILLSKRDNVKKIIQSPPDEILLSYEALDKETYESIRKRGDYNELLQNIKKLISERKKRGKKLPVVILQMVLTKKNMHMEEDFWKAAKDLGADYGSIKSLGVWPEGSAEYDRKMVEEYIVPRSKHPISRHDIDKNGNILFFRKPGQCSTVNTVLIGSGGEVIPCWYMTVKTDIMGNALDNNFIDIWNSVKYRKYRDQMLNGWANTLCHRCVGIGAPGMIKKF